MARSFDEAAALARSFDEAAALVTSFDETEALGSVGPDELATFLEEARGGGTDFSEAFAGFFSFADGFDALAGFFAGVRASTYTR